MSYITNYITDLLRHINKEYKKLYHRFALMNKNHSELKLHHRFALINNNHITDLL